LATNGVKTPGVDQTAAKKYFSEKVWTYVVIVIGSLFWSMFYIYFMSRFPGTLVWLTIGGIQAIFVIGIVLSPH
jgi:hypothetical protein